MSVPACEPGDPGDHVTLLHGAHPPIPMLCRPELMHSQIPKALELVGLSYSAWFTYRYLLFKVRFKGCNIGHSVILSFDSLLLGSACLNIPCILTAPIHHCSPGNPHGAHQGQS